MFLRGGLPTYPANVPQRDTRPSLLARLRFGSRDCGLCRVTRKTSNARSLHYLSPVDSSHERQACQTGFEEVLVQLLGLAYLVLITEFALLIIETATSSRSLSLRSAS